MTLIEKLKQIERLDSLIRRKATGSPKELAGKLHMSERNIYRLIDEMKDLGCPIEYCRLRVSYKYSSSVQLKANFSVEAEDRISIKGGTAQIYGSYRQIRIESHRLSSIKISQFKL